MSKNFWRYFYRMLILMGLIVLILMAMGGANIPNVNKSFINNVNQPFLFPNSQPQDLERNYKSCPPNKQNTEECQVYTQCNANDKQCLNKARNNGK